MRLCRDLLAKLRGTPRVELLTQNSTQNRGQIEGQIPQIQSAKALARFIYNNFSGIRVAAKSGASKKSLEDIVKVVLSVLDKEN